ncbi:cytochrome oxidase small assembly protein [Candidimonas nitroreducens]|nr:cytochrome oxidase small assembly protein [Candidimonas nitroreducens]
MTPEQRRRSRRTGLILAIIAIAIFAWCFYRGGLMMVS